MNSRRGDSRRHDFLWWYHVNKCRVMRGNRSELVAARKSPRCHVNTPLLPGLINSVIISLVLLGLSTYRNDAFSYPFIYFSWGNRYPFLYLKPKRSYPFRAEPPHIECFHMTSRRPYWCPKTMKWRPCWCPKPILWELNSFLMQTLSFVLINLHTCWPRE